MTATQQTGGQSGNSGTPSTPAASTTPRRRPFAGLGKWFGDHWQAVALVIAGVLGTLLVTKFGVVADTVVSLGRWGVPVIAVGASVAVAVILWIKRKEDWQSGVVQAIGFAGITLGWLAALLVIPMYITQVMDTRITPTALPAETPAIQTQVDGEENTVVSLPSFQEIDGVSAAAMFHARDINAWYAYCGYQNGEKKNSAPSGADFVKAVKDYSSWSADKPDPQSQEVVNRRTSLIRLAGLDDKSGKWAGENKTVMDQMFGLK